MEKCFLTSSVTIGEKVYTLNFDFNSVESLTEREARKYCNCMVPGMMWALREEGKIVDPDVALVLSGNEVKWDPLFSGGVFRIEGGGLF